MTRGKNKAFLFVSIFIVLSDFIFIVLNYRASLATLDQDVEEWAHQTQNIFEIMLDAKSCIHAAACDLCGERSQGRSVIQEG